MAADRPVPRTTPLGLHPLIELFAWSVAGASTIARFVVPSALWLDEALSVNIAKLPLGQITEALRHDGHPPLYYWILHLWMSVFGEETFAVRSLSALIYLAGIPLLLLVAAHYEPLAGERRRRLGAVLVLVYMLSPFGLRFASETRMYSMVIVMVLAGFVCVERALHHVTARNLAAIVGLTAALLWTHYWALWLIMAVSGLLVCRALFAHRHTNHERRNDSIKVLAAVLVGCLLFVPWLPNLIYQSQHTGTPWAKPFRPASLIVTSLVDFGGGPYGEPQLLSMFMMVIVAIAVFGRGVAPMRIELDLHSRPQVRGVAMALIATIGIASMAGIATGMAFASRYASVFFPMFVILVALGLHQFLPGLARDVAMACFVLLSIVGLVVVFRLNRSQAELASERLRESTPTALVVSCPDQLGPSVERALHGQAGYEVVAYPDMASPLRVDWVDYKARNATYDPAAAARRADEVAGERPIAVMYGDQFITLEGQCPRFVEELSKLRTERPLMRASSDGYYEPMDASLFERAR